MRLKKARLYDGLFFAMRNVTIPFEVPRIAACMSILFAVTFSPSELK
jgi:hypothetical protein